MFKRALFISFFILFYLSSSAQKVGLVLSGGGAKGLYHIGVIKALEENEIPIDFVAGTSMGSIVAGMYAAGYTPEQMTELAMSGKVETWLTGKFDERYRHYYMERYIKPAFFTLNLGRKSSRRDSGEFQTHRERSLMFPSELFSSNRINIELPEIFRPASVAAGGDFRKLMVPFLCVSSDMKKRKPVIFLSGNLDEAIRGSMSIPLVFQPLKIDDMILYDGGLFDNFPWKKMKESFSPDHIIGVKCTTENQPVDTKNNIFVQAISLMMNDTDYKLPNEGNVFIDREVDAGMLEFQRAAEIIELGYEDTIAKMDQIKSVITSRRSAQQLKEIRDEFKSRVPEFTLSSPQFTGVTRQQAKYVRTLFHEHQKRDKETYTYDQFRSGMSHVLADGDFTMEYPKFKYDDTIKRFEPVIDLSGKSSMKLLVGGNLSSTAYNQIRLGLNYMNIGRVGFQGTVDMFLGPVYQTGRVGGQIFFVPKIPVYMSAYLVLVARNTLYGNFGNLTVVDNTERMKELDLYGTFSIGTAFYSRGTVQLTMNVGRNQFKFDPELPYAYFTYMTPKLQVHYNSLNDPLWATRGMNASVSAIYVYGQDKFRDIYANGPEGEIKRVNRQWFGFKFECRKFFNVPQVKWLSLGLDVDMVYTNHPDFNNDDYSFLTMPQYAPIPHVKMAYMPDYHASKYIGVGGSLSLMPFKNFFIRPSAFAMYRNRENDIANWKYILDFSFIYKTMVGPLSLSLTKYGVHNSKNLFLGVNFGYLMFTSRSTHY